MTYNHSDHPETNEMIGQRYQIVRQLREEPWGGVWLAQDNILRTEVSLKLLARDARSGPRAGTCLNTPRFWD